MSLDYRCLTPRDIDFIEALGGAVEFYEDDISGVTVFYYGSIVAVGGLLCGDMARQLCLSDFDDPVLAFFSARPTAYRFPKTMHKNAVEFFSGMRASGLYTDMDVFTMADQRLVRANVWCERLGFRATGLEYNGMREYLWQQSALS